MTFFFKLLLKAGVTLGVMFIGYKFLIGGMSGMQLPGLDDMAPDGLSELGDEISSKVIQEDVTVYKWTDSQGVTHFGGTPPTGQGEYESKTIHANANTMNALKIPEEVEEEKARGSRITRVGSVYSPEGVKDVVTDAQDLQKMMDDRMAEQQELLNSLKGKPTDKKR